MVLSTFVRANLKFELAVFFLPISRPRRVHPVSVYLPTYLPIYISTYPRARPERKRSILGGKDRIITNTNQQFKSFMSQPRPTRTSKRRLRGVENTEEEGRDTVDEVIVDGGEEGEAREGKRASSQPMPTGCKLTQDEVDEIDAVIDKYKVAAERAMRALPENVTVTGHELDAATRGAVRHVLMSNSQCEGGLVLGKDLNAVISGLVAAQKKGIVQVVVAKAQHVLASKFGVEMLELEKAGVKSGGKYYVLRSMCPGRVYPGGMGDETGLLGLLVALIYMSCGSLPEPELMRHMMALGVNVGKVGEVVDDAVRKRYVKVDKASMEGSVDEAVKVYAVAERAVAEGLTEDAVLRAVQEEFV